ncbi:MAG TPA: hypothetical protein VFF73_33035 [Planctomycetota bacterium]|nr:hypothetical protein [Planctomycetota bacterium]
MEQDGVEPEEAVSEEAPDAPRSRIRARVNRPAPKTKSFGTGEPGFVKAPGRSPGSDPAVESTRLPAGALPVSENERPFELSRPPESMLASLGRRVRGLSLEEWIIGLAILAAIAVGVFFLAHSRGHA